uniref:Uncharacterized protein n=1 Tax=Chromera velia CCMP2878 TaxID=1169474 RepID=A0A0G4F6I8_9ALVE|eukprot:Cvel_15277.t1-p1 / transcript=Cvel_15277.t1 / gene=Cvel_15277 / organism=Chromera_velia_CCMP2878 / gene_product=hypothetical protein / transcript_product=hypothetical protein / location=Cvel_scaffold1121:9024-13694(-) / protein_length=626 / sequence_SO=supercontig / SO=protein_coding / is_pseudo=false
MVAADSSLSAVDAIKGKTFKVAFDPNYPPYGDYSTQTGFSYDVINELARRGGFSVSIANLGEPSSGESWDDLLKRTLEAHTYDWLGTFWTETYTRSTNNAAWAYHYVDVGEMLLAEKPQELESNILTKMATFIEPFSPFVWLCLFALIVGAGFIHWYVDRDRREEARNHWQEYVLRKVTLKRKKYAYLLTRIRDLELNQKNLQKKCDEEKAAREEEEDLGEMTPVMRDQSMKSVQVEQRIEHDIIPKQMSWDEEAALELIDPLERPEADTQKFPGIGSSVFMQAMAFAQLGPNPSPFSGLAKLHVILFSLLAFIIGAAYTANLATFLIKAGLVSANEKCDMRIVGRTIIPRGGSFAFHSLNDCQAYVRAGLNVHLLEMEEDGFLAVDDVEEIHCTTSRLLRGEEKTLDPCSFWILNNFLSCPFLSSRQASEEFQPSVQLTVDAFSGLFAVYGFLAFVIIVMAYFRARTRKVTDRALTTALSKAKGGIAVASNRMSLPTSVRNIMKMPNPESVRKSGVSSQGKGVEFAVTSKDEKRVSDSERTPLQKIAKTEEQGHAGELASSLSGSQASMHRRGNAGQQQERQLGEWDVPSVPDDPQDSGEAEGDDDGGGLAIQSPSKLPLSSKEQ